MYTLTLNSAQQICDNAYVTGSPSHVPEGMGGSARNTLRYSAPCFLSLSAVAPPTAEPVLD
jgi:hypothetical protein